MIDIFEPRNEPARSIYRAFQAEAKKRNGRTADEFITAEREAVINEAASQAQKLGLRAPTLDEVIRAENSACGHCDYGAKWAMRVAEVMTATRS